MSSKAYVASRFGRRNEVAALADELRALGLVITSTWFKDGQNMQNDAPEGSPGAMEANRDIAVKDWEEILEATIFITLTEDMKNLPEGAARGGRHCEFGIALGAGMHIIIIGPREHIFHYVPDLWVYKNTEEFLNALHNRIITL